VRKWAITAGSEGAVSRAAPLLVAALLLLCILTCRSVTLAQSATGPARRSGSSRSAAFAAGSRLAADLVKLKSGRTLRGTIAHSEPDGSLTLAVSREWLRKADPKLLVNVEADEARTRPAALEQLRDRIKAELAKVPEESGVATFLRSEAKRIEKLLAEPTPPAEPAATERPQFVWIELTKKKIAKIAPATADRKQVAGWSWYEKLANVETRDAEDLARELRRKRIDPSQALPDLSDRLPLRVQDEREWSARMALVTDALGKPLEFQGTGDLLVRADRSKNAGDIAPLVAKMFGGQVDSLLKDLLSEGRPAAATSKPPNAWLEPAIKEAERDKARAFRATRLDFSLERRQATVNSAFVVQLAGGKWEILWSDRRTEDGAQARPEMEAGIATDPQVKSALSLFKSLGANGDDQVGSAIRFGAATMAAQQAVNQHFLKFEEPYLRQLDGPPLWWAN
jgi:hypothetical protein